MKVIAFPAPVSLDAGPRNTDPGITRNEALTVLKQHIKNEKLISHCLASEVIMLAMACKLGLNENQTFCARRKP